MKRNTGCDIFYDNQLIGKNPLVDIMSRKKFIIIGMVVGSIAGGYAPVLLGADSITVSLVGSALGGFLGIWGAFKFYG
ncbi:MAG TPA: hypothetical protein DDX93_00715 [Smithella sp.]|nr:hypothetical protein [Smithella sp.]